MTTRPIRTAFVSTFLVLAAGLPGCGDDQAALQAWMEQTRRDMPPVRDTIPAPKRFESYRYAGAGQVDPFSATRLRGAEAQVARPGGQAPDANRRREPLEGFPLDAIRMVGHVQSGTRSFALLMADNLVYQVRAGQYIGPDHGQVIRITETAVTLRERVQDAAGEWVSRETTLQLQENRK